MALQIRRAKTDWSGCCQMAVQGALWLAKHLSLNLNFSFRNRISLLLISSSYPIVLTRLGGPRSRSYTSIKISRVWPNIIRNLKSRRLIWAGTCTTYGRNAYRVLVGKPEGKKSLGRLRRRWENKIKMDLREVGWDAGDWIYLAENRDQRRHYIRVVINHLIP